MSSRQAHERARDAAIAARKAHLEDIKRAASELKAELKAQGHSDARPKACKIGIDRDCLRRLALASIMDNLEALVADGTLRLDMTLADVVDKLQAEGQS